MSHVKEIEQQAFDIFAPGLLEQNCKSERWETGCAYRGTETNEVLEPKCAIGMLIPDEDYQPRFESVPLTAVMDMLPDLFFPMCNLKQRNELTLFYMDVQRLHDSMPVGEWRPYLERLAKKYGLKTDCIHE